MGRTFLNLQDKAIKYGYNEVDRPRLKEFLNDAVQDIFSRYTWSWAEGVATLTLAAGASSVAMPSTATTSYVEGRIQKVTSPTTLKREPPRYEDYMTTANSWVDELVENVGYPARYTVWNGTVYFDMVADQQYQFQFTYWTQPTQMSLDADEPPIPDQFREVIVYGAVSRQALRDHDQTLYGNMVQQYEGGIQVMRRMDKRGRGADNTAALPNDYGEARFR